MAKNFEGFLLRRSITGEMMRSSSKYWDKIMKIKSFTFVLAAAAGLLFNAAAVQAADDMAMMEPVKSVYDQYLKIQAALAKDSMTGVPAPAKAIAAAVKGDKMKMLPDEVAAEAEALANAKDVSSAREAFKPLSKSLIKYLADHKVQSGSYNEVYCPMANANWLQTGKQVSNPYLGKSMPSCGEIKRTF